MDKWESRGWKSGECWCGKCDWHVECEKLPPGTIVPIDNPSLHTNFRSALSARDRLFSFHADFCRRALELMRDKNADYATAEDPLLNFRVGGLVGISVRKADKAVRDVNLTRGMVAGKTAAVESERIEDTLLDEINYAVLRAFAEKEGMAP